MSQNPVNTRFSGNFLTVAYCLGHSYLEAAELPFNNHFRLTLTIIKGVTHEGGPSECLHFLSFGMVYAAEMGKTECRICPK